MVLKVLELYSGIGGMHYGLKLSGVEAEVIAAVDINPHANLVYKHNFKETNVIQKTIEGIKFEAFDEMQFDMVLMSPPCQPFTRQGNQHGSSDNRAQSFLAFTKIIPQLKKKPTYILIENVKGFDQDEARETFLAMIKANSYSFQEFLLSPIQFGIPNSRLRYFLIAKLDQPFIFESRPEEILSTFPAEVLPIVKKWVAELNERLEYDNEYLDSLIADDDVADDEMMDDEDGESITNVPEDLNENIKLRLNNDYRDCVNSLPGHLIAEKMRPLKEFAAATKLGNSESSSLFIKDKNFFKLANQLDVVTADSTRTNCFTKNYGRKIEGTGSLLAIVDDSARIENNQQREIEIAKNKLRFLSPKEISNLHCFPKDLEYPNELTTKQKWRLIGNSLNVFCVALLIKLMHESNK